MIAMPPPTAKVRLPFFLATVLSFFCIDVGQHLSAQTLAPRKAPAPVVAMEPVDVLKLLPAAPTNWKLTASHASNDLTSDIGTQTFAIREYLFIPPPDPRVPAGTPPPPPQKTRLTLVDTGFDQYALGEFLEFKAGSTFPGEKNVRRYLLMEHPAILRTSDTGKLSLLINLALRFNVFIELENQPETNLQKWSDALNLPVLAQIAASALRSPVPPHQVRLSKIDEFNPKVNRSVLQGYYTAAEQQAIDKADHDSMIAKEKHPHEE